MVRILLLFILCSCTSFNVKNETLHPVSLSSPNATKNEQKQLKEVAALMSEIVGSSTFRNRILTYNYIDSKGIERNKFADTSYSNYRVYQLIINSEEYDSDPDGVLTLNIKYYSEVDTDTVAYVIPALPYVYVNREYVVGYCNLVDTLMHEWLHKLLFSHSEDDDNLDKPYSVPYAVGRIAGELCRRNFI